MGRDATVVGGVGGPFDHQAVTQTMSRVLCGRCGRRYRNPAVLVVTDGDGIHVAETDERRGIWEPDCACRPIDARVETVAIA